MVNFSALFYQLHSHEIMALAVKLFLRESLFNKFILTVGYLAGFCLFLSGCSSSSESLEPDPIPTLSSVSSEEVRKYAMAVLAIEPKRQDAYEEIQRLTKQDEVPNFTCTQADTLADLPVNVQDIAVNYCQESKKIAEGQDFTMAQFNAITKTVQSDLDLERKIQNELVRIQPE